MKLIEMVGTRFGRLTVIAPADSQTRELRWACRCDCGATVDAYGSNLRRGRGHCGTACVEKVGRRPWPTDPRYFVGRDGSIAGPSGMVLTPYVADTGYLTVATGRGKTTVHVMVAETYLGPRPDGQEVAHENGDQMDCRVENLRWSTHLDNMRDRDRHGTVPHGERVFGAKLTEAEVREIRASSTGPIELGLRYGVHYKTIIRVRKQQSWRRVA